MKKVGMIVAIETDAIFARYQNIDKLPAPNGFELFEVKDEKMA